MPVDRAGLTPLELASGIVFGRDPDVGALPRRVSRTPRPALERALLRALRRPPCLIGFSGGRDSSGLLAVSVALARREGLPAPVPVTWRFPAAPMSHESEWQERVIAHVGVDDWVRLEHGVELDLVGPVAQRVMAGGRVPYPHNLHLSLLTVERARGGTYVTGVGGDQALTGGEHGHHVLARRTPAVPADALRIGARVAPRAVQRPLWRRRSEGLRWSWMTDHGNALLSSAVLDDDLRHPFLWDRRLREHWRSRFVHLTRRRLAELAAPYDVHVVNPYLEPDFVAAVARVGGPTGFASRTDAMRVLFADVLPEAVLARGTKAVFNEALFADASRAFVASLGAPALERALRATGAQGLVDPQALLAEWRLPMPSSNSFLLLQACAIAHSHEGSRVGREL